MNSAAVQKLSRDLGRKNHDGTAETRPVPKVLYKKCYSIPLPSRVRVRPLPPTRTWGKRIQTLGYRLSLPI